MNLIESLKDSDVVFAEIDGRQYRVSKFTGEDWYRLIWMFNGGEVVIGEFSEAVLKVLFSKNW
jgi:hypothetical protein